MFGAEENSVFILIKAGDYLKSNLLRNTEYNRVLLYLNYYTPEILK